MSSSSRVRVKDDRLEALSKKPLSKLTLKLNEGE